MNINRKHGGLICCDSVLSLVWILHSLIFFFKVMYDNKFEPKENKIWTRDESELQLTSILSWGFQHTRVTYALCMYNTCSPASNQLFVWFF